MLDTRISQAFDLGYNYNKIDQMLQIMQDLNIEKPEFIVALGSVNFQLGTRWMNKFPSAYKALSRKDYDEAIRQVSTG